MPNQSIFDLGFAKQASKGTAAAAAQYRVPVMGGTPMPLRNVEDLEETTRKRLRSRTYVREVGVQGAPEFAVRPNFIGLLLYLALGSKSADATDPAAVVHTFVPANLQPWSTWWRMLGDLLYERFVDVKVSQLVIVSESGRPLRATATLVGRTPQAINAATFTTEAEAAALDDGDPIMHYDGAGALLVEGAAASSIESVTVTINNNDSRTPGDALTSDDVTEGMLDITIATTQRIEDAALYNRFHYGSATPSVGAQPAPEVIELAGSGIDFKWTAVDNTPGPEESLRIAATRLQIQNLTGYEPGTGSDPLKREATYRVVDPGGATAGITATLINGEASY